MRRGFPTLIWPTERSILGNDRRPSIATFFVGVQANSMKDAGILDGDTLVVDRFFTTETHPKQIDDAVVQLRITLEKLSKA